MSQNTEMVAGTIGRGRRATVDPMTSSRPAARIITAPEQFGTEGPYIDLLPVFDEALYLKCEGFNFAGSVKQRAAVEMVDAAESAGLLHSDSILVESSSGNMGIALSMIAASRGYGFVCITDSRCNHSSRRTMEALGAQVRVVDTPDPVGGLLAARIKLVRDLCASDSRYVWLDQYANPNNWLAHYRRTAPAIAEQFPELELLFVGAGTTGTLMGCARYFSERRPWVSVVAVDAIGSVTFGGAAAKRLIPGLGTSVRPQHVDESLLHDIVHVEEVDTIRVCRAMARRGYLFGGSTGTVVSGALNWLAGHRTAQQRTSVAIAPDLGERYLDSIYHDDWVRENFELDDFTGMPSLEGRSAVSI